ncbi:multicopper oxidase domain-containing protein [Pseudonocardia sp.]|uniref:multicopper oxidase domain-containing protein n=1 Tax=Pseudonocardia sp. TaxID=60912 RepID=UPI0025E213C9|nr:multicopper oxidase domain-containing protein [Pseudonocardia sp.]
MQPGLPLVQIGSDGGLPAAPVSHATIEIAPGERFDVDVHLDGFPVLRRGSGGHRGFDAGWKDPPDLRPAEIVDVAVRFSDHVGRFVLHRHNLEHEDMAMTATIRTV